MPGPSAAGANDPNIPRRKEISSRDVFVWMGHGNEIPIEFDERKAVPDGKIIVLLAEYGKPVKGYRGEDIWKKMATNPEVFRKPESETTKALLKDTVHVYYPGDKLPKFLYYPFLVQKDSGKWAAYPSGVYKLDMEKKSGFALPSTESGEMEKRNVSRGPVPWNNIFSGDENKALLENAKEKNRAINASASMNGRKAELERVFVKDSNELIDELPNGIHYFMSCRLIKGQAARVIHFFEKLKEDIEFLIQYCEFQNFKGTNDYFKFEDFYKKKGEDLETRMSGEIYNGLLHKLLLRTYFIRNDDSNTVPENADEDYLISEYFLHEGLNDVLRCINATLLQSSQRGPFTADEFIDYFNDELKGFKKSPSRQLAPYKLFFQKLDEVIREGLRHILEPVEKTRRLSIAQQQKAGKRTRKLKKKSKSKTR